MPDAKKWVIVDKGNGLIVGCCDGVIDDGDSGGPELSITKPIIINAVDVPVPGIQGFNVERRTVGLPVMPWAKPFDETVTIIVPLAQAQWYSWVGEEEIADLRTRVFGRGGAG